MINLQQQYLEEYLLDACTAQPLIDLRWGNKVVGVSQQADFRPGGGGHAGGPLHAAE